MREMQRNEASGYLCVYANVEADDSPATFIASLISAALSKDAPARVQDGVRRYLRQLLPSEVSVEGAGLKFSLAPHLEVAWQQRGEELVGQLIKLSESQGVVLMVDELPFLLNRLRLKGGVATADAELLLQWLRKIRNDEALRRANIRFILSGSIGLEGIVSRMGLSRSINDLLVVPLPPLSHDDADGLLIHLGEEEGATPMSPACRAAILAKMERPQPYYLQLFYQCFNDAVTLEGADATVATVEAVYTQKMLGQEGELALRHMDERLGDILDQAEVKRVRSVLQHACHTPAGLESWRAQEMLGTDDDENASSLLELLLHDGYLERSGERLRFQTGLLKAFWARRYPRRRAR